MAGFAFSNFQPAVVHDELGIEYPTVEHYYQAQKTFDQDQRRFIAALPTPAQAKRHGRTLDLRHDWESMKVSQMAAGLAQKFRHGTAHARALLATGDQPLVEENYWHDNFWGSCTCKRCANHGRNVLGILLMALRKHLREAR